MATKAPQSPPQAGETPKPAPAQQQGSEAEKPVQQQGGTRFTDWAAI